MVWNRLGLNTQCGNEKTPDGINQPEHTHLLGASALMAYPANGLAMSRAARNMAPEAPACWTVRLRQLQTP